MYLVNSVKLKKVNLVVSLFCFLVSVILMINSDSNQYYLILPLFYFFSVLILMPERIDYGYGFIILNMVWVLRFLFIPILYSFNPIDRFTDSMINISLFILVLETIFGWFGVYLHSIVRKNKKMNKRNMDQSTLVSLSVSRFPLFIFTISCVLIIVMFPSVISSFNSAFGSSDFGNSNLEVGSITLVINIYKYVITLCLLSYFSDKYRSSKNTVYILLSLLIVILSLSIFIGTGRNGLLIDGMAYLLVLNLLFPKFRKQMNVIVASFFIFVILLLTMSRFFAGVSFYSIGFTTIVNSLISSLDPYFSGIANITYGVKTVLLYSNQYNFQTFLKDIFANTVLVNRLLTKIPGTVFYFNYTIYNHGLWADQISPIITQSIALFSVLGFIIPTIISFLIMKLDLKALTSKSILKIFLYTTFSVNLAFYSHGNLTILATYFFNHVIPLAVAIYILEVRILVIPKKSNYDSI